jgi:hypothetical protein
LPAFPDAHTYQHTPAFQGHEADAQRQRKAVLASKQQAEAALVKLHQRLIATAAGAATQGAGTGAGGATGSGHQPGANPFLAPPGVVGAADAAVLRPELGDVALGAAADGADLGAADFDTGAAQRVFRVVLPPADTPQKHRQLDGRQQDQAYPQHGANGGDAAMMDVDGPTAGSQWVAWTPDAPGGVPIDGAAGGLRRQDLLQLQWHDPAKAESVLGAAARQRPPDAYQERAEAAMAAEGAATGGARQRKSAYGRGNAELQRADELLRAGHAAAVGGVFGEDDEES